VIVKVSFPTGAFTPTVHVRPPPVAATHALDDAPTFAVANVCEPIAIVTDCVLAEKSSGRRDVDDDVLPAGIAITKFAFCVPDDGDDVGDAPDDGNVLPGEPEPPPQATSDVAIKKAPNDASARVIVPPPRG
jgi:hypothetical protein